MNSTDGSFLFFDFSSRGNTVRSCGRDCVGFEIILLFLKRGDPVQYINRSSKRDNLRAPSSFPLLTATALDSLHFIFSPTIFAHFSYTPRDETKQRDYSFFNSFSRP